MSINRKWQVVINLSYRYIVEAPYAAEASHEAVVKWRNDESLTKEIRKAPVRYIETQWLELVSVG